MRAEQHREWSDVEWPRGSLHFHSQHGSHEENAKETEQEMRHSPSGRLSLWEPLYLRKWVLIGFSFVFVVLLTSLEAIYVYSRDHSGLTSTSQQFHYIWTYAPAAVFTLVAALCMRVEYQMKLVAPWANMAKGSTTSQHTIQLDYISMIKVFSIWPAFKNKYYNIALASIVTISLQVSIILSTGLFILLPTKMQSKSVPISVQSRFVNSTDGIKANPQLPALLVVGHQASHLPYPLGLSDGSDSPHDQRILAIWGNTVCPVPNPRNISLDRVAVLLCLPNYAIREVEVVYTAGQEETVKINQIPGATERQLSTVHPWDIAQVQFDLHTWSSNPGLYETNAVSEAIAMQLQADYPTATALSLYTNDTIPYVELLDAKIFEQMIQQYYTRIGAAIGHVELTSFSNDMVIGSTWFIVGLLVLSIVMSISLIALTPREKLILLQNPGSIIGIATHIYQSEQLIVGLRGQGSSSDKSLQEHTKDWKVWTSRSDSSPQLFVHVEDVAPEKQQMRNPDQSTWLQPLIIRPVSRILICLLMIILILTLELLLRDSGAHNGLAAISNIDSLHYLWTWLPSFVMVLVGLVVGAVEFVVICHSPFWYLKSKMAIKFLDSNLLDNTRPALIAQAIQTRSLVIVLASVAVVLNTAGSLKILEMFLLVNTLDLNTEVGSTMDLAAPLILTQNLSFPTMTTEELVIPKVELVEQVDMENASITALLPALRTSMECTPYQASEMKHQSGISEFDGSLTVNITFPRTEMCLSLEGSNQTVRFPAYLQSENLQMSLKNDTILGASAAAFQLGPLASPVDCQSDFYFAYGFYGDSQELSGIQGLDCKFTPKLVMANVTLTGPELWLDVQNIYYETDAISGTLNYLKAYSNFNKYIFETPISLGPAIANDSSLDDPAISNRVAAAIQRQLTLIQTQNNQHCRRSLDSIGDIAGLIDQMNEQIEFGDLAPISPEKNTSQLIGDILNVHDIITKLNPTRGTITNSYLVRLVQDVASTRLLQGLLGIMLVCMRVVSVLMPTKTVLPREPTSIVSVAALLSDGNLLGRLPVNAQSEKPRDYWWSWGRGLDFRLEWREDKKNNSLGVRDGADAETNECSEIGLDEYLVIEDEELHSEITLTSQNTALTAWDEKHVDILTFGIFVIPN
ncbi:hypothetical protein E0Z10_g5658 [Xylaria hypoxylon]|uniref:Uncharacterized protein n=1 Tax=Xylaria hypoxylon TaxID=37992 RepID=A0A4Z0YVB9_9PEZI|nr:hypothetical protein E0Z10_g5658 [Xylaria hypoxylon]